MTEYNLGVLNDKEFENLCRDLLELELKRKLQTFARGKDKGIDFRFSGTRENTIIIQAKHYLNSKFSDLRTAIRKELIKIKKLKPRPKRYILITSLSLSVGQVDELFTILKPFIKSSNDIYGQERINQLLQKHHDIEKKYYKLWISSTVILKSILNNASEGRSEFYEEKILKKLKRYVPTKDYKEAIAKLSKERFIIVTGAPGIGKTTISYLLICELLAKKFQLIYIQDKLVEAEQQFSKDPKKKQVFFFDDFLGSNLHAIINPKNTDSSIVGFIDRVKASKNKLLILTTRTTILNQAEHTFEKLGRSRVSSISRYEIAVSSYTRLDKAKILYNHLYHSDIPAVHLDKVYKNYSYYSVIEHRNYSPRLIEFITDNYNYNERQNPDYIKFIIGCLDNPQEIWSGAYENQLQDNDRFLLLTLFSLGGYYVKSNDLEEAYQNRLKWEVENTGYILPNNPFNSALRNLLDGLILSKRDVTDHQNRYSFINPSVGDFILNYLKENRYEVLRILLSATYVDQLTQHIQQGDIKAINLGEKELNQFYDSFISKSKELKCRIENSSLSVEVLRIYFLYFGSRVDEKRLIPWVESLVPAKIASFQLSSAIILFEVLHGFLNCRNLLLLKWNEFIVQFYKLANTDQQFKSIKSIFQLYSQDFNSFHAIQDNNELVAECIVNMFKSSLKDDFEISERNQEHLVSLIHNDDHQSAETLVEELVSDEFGEFISSLNLDDYIDRLEDVNFNVTQLVDRLYNQAVTENEGIDSDFGRYERHRSETTEIENLFQK